jgi:hypothetical protein
MSPVQYFGPLMHSLKSLTLNRHSYTNTQYDGFSFIHPLYIYMRSHARDCSVYNRLKCPYLQVKISRRNFKKQARIHKKQKLTHSVEGLTKMANNVINYENNTTKATETSANFSTKMCDHSECNKLKTASHTSSKCWRKHPDQCPKHLRDKFGKRKNN